WVSLPDGTCSPATRPRSPTRPDSPPPMLPTPRLFRVGRLQPVLTPPFVGRIPSASAPGSPLCYLFVSGQRLYCAARRATCTLIRGSAGEWSSPGRGTPMPGRDWLDAHHDPAPLGSHRARGGVPGRHRWPGPALTPVWPWDHLAGLRRWRSLVII